MNYTWFWVLLSQSLQSSSRTGSWSLSLSRVSHRTHIHPVYGVSLHHFHSNLCRKTHFHWKGEICKKLWLFSRTDRL